MGINDRDLVGKDGTEWEIVSTTTTHPGRLPRQNALRQAPGSTPYAKGSVTATSEASSRRLLINKPMLKHIKLCTESEAGEQLQENTWCISLMEIDAFIACLYAHRFGGIMKFLRFDLKDQISTMLVKGKSALVSEVWDSFIENCFLCYVPGANITVAEQPFPTKARCKFTQYMANKSDKFGIQFRLAADDDNRPPNQSLPEDVMKRMAPYFGKGRAVTTDNFFTSVSLAEKLKMQSTSLVGTVNRARREIPQSVKTIKSPLSDTVVTKNNEANFDCVSGKEKQECYCA
ncbi:hypothetical protein PR048_018540 [Dryococelus australis]|uniref:PiggyBac transposable element-derived protein domain-containing protein n=1 Tax=Dryococelus australis TaxID=614101 RepID=A0ABQ9HCR6_9NEOP|nr:hypothetical protein PR048_018540 [Dryococelus australis]